MAKLTFPVKSFKRLDDPHPNCPNRVKYRFYIEVKNVPIELLDWMNTNPREQNLSTDVAKDIKASLSGKNKSFHLWNRGVLFSADDVSYDNKSQYATILFSDIKMHGNIDGGHTLRIICEHNKSIENNPNAYYEQYIEFEIIIGLESPILLAEARNTSTQVDTTSIEELKKSYECIKNIIKEKNVQGDYYGKRVSYKQNQHHDDKTISNVIDVRELIAIINMFNPVLYPLSGSHPMQSYTGKETSLRKFLNMGLHKDDKEADKKNLREKEIEKMSHIIPDILNLWDIIECDLPKVSKSMNKRYGRKAYSGYKEDDDKKPIEVGTSMFSNKALNYLVPKGLMYPLVGAFRALIIEDTNTGYYKWITESPLVAWNELSEKLLEGIMNSSLEQNDNPNSVGKSISAWDGLYSKVYIYSLEKRVKI